MCLLGTFLLLLITTAASEQQPLDVMKWRRIQGWWSEVGCSARVDAGRP
jgi:hypothetical protein